MIGAADPMNSAGALSYQFLNFAVWLRNCAKSEHTPTKLVRGNSDGRTCDNPETVCSGDVAATVVTLTKWPRIVNFAKVI